MTRVIRNRNGCYFKGGGAWTPRFDEAQKFEDIGSSALANQRYQLQEAELVLMPKDRPSRESDIVLTFLDLGFY